VSPHGTKQTGHVQGHSQKVLKIWVNKNVLLMETKLSEYHQNFSEVQKSKVFQTVFPDSDYYLALDYQLLGRVLNHTLNSG